LSSSISGIPGHHHFNIADFRLVFEDQEEQECEEDLVFSGVRVEELFDGV
jgi:hypothetical protein